MADVGFVKRGGKLFFAFTDSRVKPANDTVAKSEMRQRRFLPRMRSKHRHCSAHTGPSTSSGSGHVWNNRVFCLRKDFFSTFLPTSIEAWTLSKHRLCPVHTAPSTSSGSGQF